MARRILAASGFPPRTFVRRFSCPQFAAFLTFTQTMLTRSSLFILVISLASAAAAHAVTLSLERVPYYVLAHNKALAAARLRIDEARGRLRQSGRLNNPELELEFTRHTVGPEGSLGIALMQRFPLTARLRHEKAARERSSLPPRPRCAKSSGCSSRRRKPRW